MFSRLRETAFGRALIASVLLHGLLVAFVPGFRNMLPSMPLPERLDVFLKPPAEVSRELTRQAPAPERKLERRNEPSVQPQTRRRVEATPRVTEQRVISTAPDAAPPTATVTEPARSFEAAPARSLEPAPAPEVFKPVEPEAPRPAPVVDLPSDSMIAAYGSGFKAAVDKNRRYPRAAQERGWQGTATVLVRVLPGGRLGDVSIASSSGFDLLDNTARDMVKSAQLPTMPEALRHHGFEMRIPVEFKLV